MKVVFLDIDGVLNSRIYDLERTAENDQNIDESRLPLLARIIEETGAVIVLSSTWRVDWEPNPEDCNFIGKELHDIFGRHGIQFYDKTGENKEQIDSNRKRVKEIREWLEAHAGEVERFVILDDIFGGWGDLEEHLVHTDYFKKRGLEEEHVEKAIAILNE